MSASSAAADVRRLVELTNGLIMCSAAGHRVLPSADMAVTSLGLASLAVRPVRHSMGQHYTANPIWLTLNGKYEMATPAWG